MKKKQDFIVSGKQIFVGWEDSKRTWKLCVRSAGRVATTVAVTCRIASGERIGSSVAR
jgi:hypothetical protein